MRWVAFGVLATAALLSIGLDAADVPEASHAVDVMVEQLVMPQLERQWRLETTALSGSASGPPARVSLRAGRAAEADARGGV